MTRRFRRFRRCGVLRFVALTLAVAASPASAHAAVDADAAMAQLAARSPLAQHARGQVAAAIRALRAPALRSATRDALFAPQRCIRHRIGLDDAARRAIVAALRRHDLLAPGVDDATARDGLFPALAGDAGGCPHLAAPVLAAPGGNSGSHHGWPGGLAVHLATNLADGMALAGAYRRAGAVIDRDALAAAILWHDWGKALVLRWGDDGTTRPELQVAGTGVHHILGLAEAMAAGLSPAQVAVQACAHAPPPRTAQWLLAAAIVARRDPADYRAAATPECLINHLADQNWIFGDAAITAAERRLAGWAGRFGYSDVADRARYNRCWRAPLLAWWGADALYTLPERAALARIARTPGLRDCPLARATAGDRQTGG